MDGSRINLKLVLTAAAAFAASAGPAHAYLDPGTGSLILQGVIGSIAGGLVVLRAYWAKISAFLPGRRNGTVAVDDADQETSAAGTEK